VGGSRKTTVVVVLSSRTCDVWWRVVSSVARFAQSSRLGYREGLAWRREAERPSISQPASQEERREERGETIARVLQYLYLYLYLYFLLNLNLNLYPILSLTVSALPHNPIHPTLSCTAGNSTIARYPQ
jgi:hypothetical protein